MELFEISGDRQSSVVVSVPHSGIWIPGEIREKLAVPVEEVRRKVDEFAWDLARVAEPHATVVRANVARAVIDLNRSGTVAELDLTHEPEKERERLVRLYDDRERLLWKTPVGRPPLTRAEIEVRIREYHEPYHEALRQCLKRAGRPSVLVDMHSMSDGTFDLVIGDFRGRSAGVDICERRVQRFFAARGYRAGYAGPRNADRQGRPVPAAAIRYSGGFITSCYGNPQRGRHAFQIEVNREACRRDFGRMETTFREFWAYLANSAPSMRHFP